MKLVDLLETNEIYDEREHVITIRKYVTKHATFTGVKKFQSLDNAAEQLLKTPRYLYNGPMYRVMQIDVMDLVESPSIQTLQAAFQRRAKRAERSFFSWLKQDHYAMEFFENDMFHGDQPVKAAILYEQKGSGVDVEKIIKSKVDAGRAPALGDHKNEVIAKFQQPGIEGFLVEIPGGVKFFKPSKFNDFVKLLKQRMRIK